MSADEFSSGPRACGRVASVGSTAEVRHSVEYSKFPVVKPSPKILASASVTLPGCRHRSHAHRRKSGDRRRVAAVSALVMKPKPLIWIAIVVAFTAFLAWSTLSSQNAECNVCVEFNGKSNCATASHASEDEAARSAQTTACGPIAAGMNQTIACEATVPVSSHCRAS